MRFVLIFLALGLLPTTVLSDQLQEAQLTQRECMEGGDFIKNAAFSRDNGIDREFFLGKLEDDIEVIRSFPINLRWFVKGPSSELLLKSAAKEVFDFPTTPRRHQINFIDQCLESPDWRLRSLWKCQNAIVSQRLSTGEEITKKIYRIKGEIAKPTPRKSTFAK